MRELTRQDGAWVLRTDGGELCAEAVVLAPGGPDAARRLLGPELGAVLPETPCESAVASLDLVLRRLAHDGASR